MIRTKTILIGAVMLAAQMFAASDAQAGPLLDWLRGLRPSSNANTLQNAGYNYYGTQLPGTAPGAQFQSTTAAGQFVGGHNPAGLQPRQCMKTCQKTCSRTVVNYVPYTAYRTSWKRVPVTSYRPVTNQDPCTGCTVTCMRPCTTYTYQMQRVPYTTQRPVYRTETYKVPVTTITNDCASSSGCDTCSTGLQGAPVQQGFNPAQSFGTPTPAIQSPPAPAGSNFQTPNFPADFPPSLPSGGGSTSRNQVPSGTLTTAGRYNTIGRTNQRAQVSIPRNLQKEVRRTASASPVQRDWNYSPVRLASFNQPAKAERAPVRSVQTTRTRNREVNSFWNEVK